MLRSEARAAVLCVLVLAAMPAWAVPISSNTTNGAWNSTSSWSPAQIPTADDDVTILTGHQITLPAGYTGLARNLTINSGGTVTAASPSNTNGALNVSQTLSNSGTLTMYSGVLLVGSGFTNSGTYNCTYSGATSVAGGITNNAGATIDRTGSATSPGDITVTSGDFTNNGIYKSSTKGNLIVSNGNFSHTGSWSSTVYNGDISVPNGTFTFTTNMTHGGGITVGQGGFTVPAGLTFTRSSPGALYAGSPITITTGNFTNNGTYANNGSGSLTGDLVVGNGSFSNTGVYSNTGSGDVTVSAGSFSHTGTSWNSTGYNGDISVPNGTFTFTTNMTHGGGITVGQGDFTVPAGLTFTRSSPGALYAGNPITITTGNFTNNGTYANNGSGSLTGGLVVTNGNFTNTGAYSNTGSGNVTVSTGSFSHTGTSWSSTGYNGDISVPNGTFTYTTNMTHGGGITVGQGGFTVPAGLTFTRSSPGALYAGNPITITTGNFTNNGTYANNGSGSLTGALVVSNGNFSNTGVYSNTGSGDVTVSSGSFSHTGTSWTSTGYDGDISVPNGTFTFTTNMTHGGGITVGQGGFTVPAGLTFTRSSTSASYRGNAVTITTGNFTNSGTYANTGSSAGTGDLVVSNGNFSNTGVYSNTGSGNVTVSSGSFSHTGTSWTSTGYNGDISVPNGTFTFTTNMTHGGGITVGQGGFTVPAGLTFTRSSTSGSYPGNAITITTGDFSNRGIYANIGNGTLSGSLVVSNGNFSNTSVYSNTGTGNVTVTGGDLYNNGTSWTSTNSSANITVTSGDFINDCPCTHFGSVTVRDFTNNSTFQHWSGSTQGTGILTVNRDFLNAATATFDFGTSTSAALYFRRDFTNNQADPVKAKFGAATVYFDGTEDGTINGAAVTFRDLQVNKTPFTKSVTMNAGVTLTYNSSTALNIQSGTFNTNGSPLTLSGGSTAAATGGAGGRLLISGGSTASLYNINQASGALGRVSVEGGSTVEVYAAHYLHAVSNRFDMSSGTMNYRGSGTGTTSSLSFTDPGLEELNGGWFATGGTANFLCNINSVRRARFRASGNAVIRFPENTAKSTVVLADYATTAYEATWEFNDLRVEKTMAAVVCTTGQVSGGLASAVKMNSLTVNIDASLRLGGRFSVSGLGYDVNGDITNHGSLALSSGTNHVNNGLWVSGNWSGSGGFMHGGRLVTFDGGGARTVALGSGGFYDAVVNKPDGSLSLGGNLTVERSLVVSGGTFEVGERVLTLGTASDAGTVTVDIGGTFSAVGSAHDVMGRVTAASPGLPYGFTVNLGAKIAARHAKFEYMNASGIVVNSGASIDPTDNFSHCWFYHHLSDGPMLRVENAETFTIAGPTFDGYAGCNIEKTAASSGRVTVGGGGGLLWGEDYDNDPSNLIDWVNVPEPFGLIAPRNDSINVPVTGLDFDWQDAGIGVKYDLYLGTENTSPPGELIAAGLTESQYHHPGTLEGDQDYYWRVRAWNAAGEQWSGSANFHFKTAADAVHDVGVTDIIVPAALVARNTAVYPRVTVENFGNRTEAFDVRVIISTAKDGEVFNQTERVTGLPVGQQRNFQFSTHYWTATPEGGFHVRCTTELAGDMGSGNDKRERDFEVVMGTLHDVGATAVLAPGAVVGESTEVYPRVTVENFGNRTETFDVRVVISTAKGEVFNEVEQVSGLYGGEVRDLQFSSHCWTAAPPGPYHVDAQTELAGDQNPLNDAEDKDFSVASGAVHDVGVTAIAVPRNVVLLNTGVYPKVTVENFGNRAEDFDVRVVISTAEDGELFNEVEQVIGLASGASRDFEFTTFFWTATPPADYHVLCQSELAGDADPTNDKKEQGFKVISPWPSGWHEAKPMPIVPTGKSVKDGGWLAAGPDKEADDPVIYAAKGNKATDFFKYVPTEGDSGTWHTLKPVPSEEGAKTKPPSKGCVGVSDGENYVYMTKGNNTLGFWRYNVEADTWEMLPEVPLGTGNKKVKGGTDMVYVADADTGWVYLLKGYKTEFYRFNTRTGVWDLPLPEVPYGGGKQKYDKGSFLAYDGNNSIYAHQAKYYDKAAAVRYHYMFRYDLGAGRWADTLKGMPLLGWHGGKPGKNKKSKDGAAGDWMGQNIYALKGGNTQQFFRYFPPGDSWQELDTVPGYGSTGKKKYVKQGGDIAAYEGQALFALKGNKTLEMWRYVEPTGAYGLRPAADRSGAQSGSRPSAVSRMLIAPNPLASGFATVRFGLPKAGPIVVTVFDIAGRSVLRQSTIGNRQSIMSLDLRKVPAGVYLVRLDAGSSTATQKLVVQR